MSFNYVPHCMTQLLSGQQVFFTGQPSHWIGLSCFLLVFRFRPLTAHACVIISNVKAMGPTIVGVGETNVWLFFGDFFVLFECLHVVEGLSQLGAKAAVSSPLVWVSVATVDRSAAVAVARFARAAVVFLLQVLVMIALAV